MSRPVDALPTSWDLPLPLGRAYLLSNGAVFKSWALVGVHLLRLIGEWQLFDGDRRMPKRPSTVSLPVDGPSAPAARRRGTGSSCWSTAAVVRNRGVGGVPPGGCWPLP